ncbi:MAG: hypothetical protein PHN80_03235 [Hespellia sp.]|nr:hypothetical protein [Hespellia sp.]
MEKNKKIIIGVISGIVACAIIVGGILGYRAWQQKKAEEKAAAEAAYKAEQTELLYAEVDKITKLNATSDHVDTMIYCEGDYGKVEEAVKNYFVEMFTDVQAIYGISSDERFSILYDTDAYIADAPEFAATTSAITTMKQEMSDKCDTLSNLFSEESVQKNMPVDLGTDYQALYQDIMFANGTKEDMAKVQTKLEEVKQSMSGILDKRQEMVNLLVSHQDAWEIDGTEISFYDSSLLDQYNQMLSELNAL